MLIISTFSCSTMLLFLHLVEDRSARSIHIESYFYVNLCPMFYLKAYLCHTEPFRKKSDAFWVISLFLGNNRQHMAMCAKMISSLVGKVLCNAKVHVSLGAVQGAIGSAALAAVVSLTPILQAGNWTRVSTPVTDYFFTHHYYRLAAGFSVRCCPGPKWIDDMLLVSIKH